MDSTNNQQPTPPAPQPAPVAPATPPVAPTAAPAAAPAKATKPGKATKPAAKPAKVGPPATPDDKKAALDKARADFAAAQEVLKKAQAEANVASKAQRPTKLSVIVAALKSKDVVTAQDVLAAASHDLPKVGTQWVLADFLNYANFGVAIGAMAKVGKDAYSLLKR